jgi:hypothetical protein
MLGYLSHPKGKQGVAFRKSDKELLMTDALTKLEKYTFSYNEDIFRGAIDDIEDLVTMVNGYNDLVNTYKYYNDMLFDKVAPHGITTKRIGKVRREILQLEDKDAREEFLVLTDRVDELAQTELNKRLEIRKLHRIIKDKVLYNLYLRKIKK